MSTEDMNFSQMTTFGDPLYRREGQVAEIIMENFRTDVRKTEDKMTAIGFLWYSIFTA